MVLEASHYFRVAGRRSRGMRVSVMQRRNPSQSNVKLAGGDSHPEYTHVIQNVLA